jgi:hypothetical protein
MCLTTIPWRRMGSGVLVPLILYSIIMQRSTQQIRNKYSSITVLIFVYYVYLLHVSIQLDHHQAIFMKCTTRTELYVDPFFSLALQPPWALSSSFSFMIIFTDGRIPWTSDQLVARPLPKHRTTQTQNKHIHQTSMLWVGFERTIPASERAKAVHTLDRSATVTDGSILVVININFITILVFRYIWILVLKCKKL